MQKEAYILQPVEDDRFVFLNREVGRPVLMLQLLSLSNATLSLIYWGVVDELLFFSQTIEMPQDNQCLRDAGWAIFNLAVTRHVSLSDPTRAVQTQKKILLQHTHTHLHFSI